MGTLIRDTVCKNTLTRKKQNSEFCERRRGSNGNKKELGDLLHRGAVRVRWRKAFDRRATVKCFKLEMFSQDCSPVSRGRLVAIASRQFDEMRHETR